MSHLLETYLVCDKTLKLVLLDKILTLIPLVPPPRGQAEGAHNYTNKHIALGIGG